MREAAKHGLCALALLLVAALVRGEQWADPTRPDNYRSPTAASDRAFALSAIFVSGERRVAVLNGQLLRVGDRLGDAEVVRIDDDRVVLRAGSRSIVARLNNERSDQ